MKKSIVIILLMLVLGGVSAGAYYYVKGKKHVAATVPVLEVGVTSVQEQDFYPEQSFVAKIESMDRVAIRARVTGFLTKRLFTEGEEVQEGQVLFEIEKDQFAANVRNAEAMLAKAEAAEANALAQYNRAKDLIKTKDISEARLDEREADWNSTKAQVKQAEAELDVAKLNLDYTDIRAPMNGRIGETLYSVGSIIGPESGDLAFMVSTNPMYAVFSVSENQLLDMRHSADLLSGGEDAVEFSFQFSDGVFYPLKGSFNFMDVALDNQMNTLKLRATFPNPDNELIAGQYGRVFLKAKTPIVALVIPKLAVQRDLAGNYVYIVDADGKLATARIKTGFDVGKDMVSVKEGLNVGDRVIVNNFQKIAYFPMGMPVTIESEKE